MSAHHINLERPLAFFDLETTGINLTKDRIIQISILKALPGGNHTQKTWLVNPGVPIPAESTAVHGIADADVADEPYFEEIADELLAYLDDCDVAGFNILRFDLPLMVEEFTRSHKNFDLSDRKVVDVQRIYHHMEPRNLSAAFRFYTGQSISTLGAAHAADVDTLATFHVFNRQLDRYVGQEIESESGEKIASPVFNDIDKLHELSMGRQLDLSGRLQFNDQKEVVFAFGKYKDVSVKEVFTKRDQGYYSWIMQSDFPADTKNWVTKIYKQIQAERGR